MSAADRLGGYAGGFGDLNAEAIAANVTTDYKLLDKDGAVYGKNDLPGYIAAEPVNDFETVTIAIY